MSPLVQIRQGFRARWNDLTFLVESEDRQWTLRVEKSSNHHLLYTAGRCNRPAAEAAGLEFASLCLGEQAQHLEWLPYW